MIHGVFLDLVPRAGRTASESGQLVKRAALISEKLCPPWPPSPWPFLRLLHTELRESRFSDVSRASSLVFPGGEFRLLGSSHRPIGRGGS